MSNEIEIQHQKIKDNIAVICGEIFKAESANRFTKLNYAFPTTTTPRKHLAHKLTILDSIDVYSQTFVTIHTRAKIVLREHKLSGFGFDACELLRMILTLDDSLKNKRLKSSRIELIEIVEIEPITKQKSELKAMVEKIETEKKNKSISKKTKIVKPEVSGRKFYARRIREASVMNELKEFDL